MTTTRRLAAIPRRKFMGLIGLAPMLPLAAFAQPRERVPRIGYLAFSQRGAPGELAFREGLRALGYTEGVNCLIEARYANGNGNLLPNLAAELVVLGVDVIVTFASGVPVAKQATTTIPIIMTAYGDAVAESIIASLSRPGGNITGSTLLFPEVMAKRLELLKETLPHLTAADVLLFPSPPNVRAFEVMKVTAAQLSIELNSRMASTPAELDNVFASSRQSSGLVVSDHPFFVNKADAIAAYSAQYSIASIGSPELARAGCLLAYGANISALFRRAATFVDKVLKGTKPGEIPVEQATEFLTVVNRRAAQAMRIDVPLPMLLRANEVIE